MFSTIAEMPMESYFVGRQQELELLSAYTKERGACVAVTGVSGIGKTALLRVFESKASNNFPGAVYHLSGRDGLSGIQRNLESLKKNGSHALVVLDDVELLNTSDVLSVYNAVVNQSLASLVLSGRLVPVGELPNVKVLSLSKLNTAELIKARLKLVPERADVDKALEIIEGNAALFQLLISTPRNVLQKLHDSIAAPVDVAQEATTTHIENLKVDVQLERDTGPDIVSIVLSLLLFIVAYTSSMETEERITNEIHSVEEIVSEQIHATSHKGSNNEHFATAFVNLRDSPLVKKDNIITVLAPNQTVSVLSISEGWVKVVYVDYVSSKKYDGWVHGKYIKPINEAK